MPLMKWWSKVLDPISEVICAKIVNLGQRIGQLKANFRLQITPKLR